jgi:hypothetical protein
VKLVKLVTLVKLVKLVTLVKLVLYVFVASPTPTPPLLVQLVLVHTGRRPGGVATRLALGGLWRCRLVRGCATAAQRHRRPLQCTQPRARAGPASFSEVLLWEMSRGGPQMS